jgi:hypothetical protein
MSVLAVALAAALPWADALAAAESVFAFLDLHATGTQARAIRGTR